MTAGTSATRTLIVAVDGPSGSGKSSVSRAVASRLGLRYLDTGSMYRAMTWWVLQNGIDVQDPKALAAVCAIPRIEAGSDPAAPTITVDGQDVADPIRSDPVTAAVSAVSAIPEVRARMVGLQRAAIGEGGIVVEGRDIGTAVAPHAQVKVFLTASAKARAQRRAAEHSAADPEITKLELQRRDQMDSARPTSPLRRADDAVQIDATDMTLAQVVQRVLELVDTMADPARAGARQ